MTALAGARDHAEIRAVMSGRDRPTEDADRVLAEQAVDAALRRYFDICRSRVGPFVDRHFSWRGTASLHRAALGWDILRAPANLSLALPHAVQIAAASLLRRSGRPRAASWLLQHRLLLPTEAARRVQWLILTELLQLPAQEDSRVVNQDALAAAILHDPAVEERLADVASVLARHGGQPGFQERLAEALGTYCGSRAAAAEITTNLMTTSIGAVALQQLTPGAISLGPSLAAALAHQAAVASFPLGAGLGSLWYGLFPVAPAAGLVVGLTGGLMLLAATCAAFAGLIADPVQRRLGLHRRRLLRLIDTLESQASDPRVTFNVRDHYVARLLDVLDLLNTAYRLAR